MGRAFSYRSAVALCGGASQEKCGPECAWSEIYHEIAAKSRHGTRDFRRWTTILAGDCTVVAIQRRAVGVEIQMLEVRRAGRRQVRADKHAGLLLHVIYHGLIKIDEA